MKIHVKDIGNNLRLVVKLGAVHIFINFLQGNNIRVFTLDNINNSIKLIDPVPADAVVNVVGHYL